MIRHASNDATSPDIQFEARYRFEPTATFFYEELFAPDEQPPTLFDTLRARLSRRAAALVGASARQ